jgi:aerobic carbon-monoxide dehydrogenase large subunit
MDHTRTSNRLIGSPVERLEDLRFLRGRGQYVDDVPTTDALHSGMFQRGGRIDRADTTVRNGAAQEIRPPR